jgi:Asp/Glu/hydantoin racemase
VSPGDSTVGPLVAVINASPASMEPAAGGLAEGFPEARVWQLLDARLVSDADEAGGLTPALRRRMLSLIDYAVDGGAEAILLSCSMYGPVVTLAQQLYRLLILSSDEAVFAQVAAKGGSIVVLGSLESAVADSLDRFRKEQEGVGTAGAAVTLVGVSAPGALQAALVGDNAELLNRLETAAAGPAAAADLVMLAQYSLAPVHAELQARLGVPVLSGPLLAATRLREQWLAGPRSVGKAS